MTDNRYQMIDNFPNLMWHIQFRTLDKSLHIKYLSKHLKILNPNNDFFAAPLIHADDVEQTNALWNEAVQNKQPEFKVRHRIFQQNHVYAPFWTIAKMSVNSDGDQDWFGSSSDISDMIYDAPKSQDLVHIQQMKDYELQVKHLQDDLLTQSLQKEITEKTRIELSAKATVLADELISRELEKQIEQQNHLDLQKYANDLEKQLGTRHNDIQIAEKTKQILSEKVSSLAKKIIDIELEKKVAEKTRVCLSEKAQILATDAEHKAEEKKIAETLRNEVLQETRKMVADASNLAEQSDAKAVQKDIDDHTRINLKIKADILAKEVAAKIEQFVADKKIARDNALQLSDDAKRLSAEVLKRTVADQQLKIVINSIPVILWLIDMQGKFTMSEGQSLVEIFETPGRLVGTSCFEYLPSEMHDNVNKGLQGHSSNSRSTIKQRHFDMFFTPMSFNYGIIGVIVLARDVTEQILQESERDSIIVREKIALADARLKSNFLANFSHEVRSPIYGIMTNIDFLLETILTTSQRTDAEMIRQSLTYLTVIVDDMMDISQLNAQTFVLQNSVFDLHQTVESTISLLRTSAIIKDLDCCLTMSDDLPSHVIGDQARLQQLLVNIVNNAVKFTDKGSVTIDVTCDKTADAKNLLNIHICISDTGIGMDQKTLQELFEAFNQADTSDTRLFSGIGLGMSISQHIAKLMHGSITVKSQINQGSSIYVNVQLQKTTPPIMMVDPKNTTPLSGVNVLVVEDNLINQKIVCKTLTKAGALAAVAANGQNAIDMWSAHKNYNLILMDCQMPILDGYQATVQLRNMNCSVPIIALTANALLENKEKCIDSGMNEVVVKPVKPSVLITIIVKCLTEKFLPQNN